jgi:hypothetical protein
MSYSDRLNASGGAYTVCSPELIIPNAVVLKEMREGAYVTICFPDKATCHFAISREAGATCFVLCLC